MGNLLDFGNIQLRRPEEEEEDQLTLPQEAPAQPQLSAPPLLSGPPTQPKSDLVAEYIKSKLQPKPQESDPGLQRAQITDALGNATSGMGRQFDLANAQFQSAVSGFTNHPKAADSFLAPEGPKSNSVQSYLQAKQAEKAASDADVGQLEKLAGAQKSIAEARKADAQVDALDNPNTTKAQEIELKRDALGLRRDDLKHRIESGQATLEEQKRYHDMVNQFRKDHAGQEDRRLSNQERSLGMRREKLENEEGAGIVPLADSQDRYLKPTVANETNDKLGAATALRANINSMLEIEQQHRLGMLAPSEAQAKMQVLASEFPGLLNAAQTKLSLSGARVSQAMHAFADPRTMDSSLRDLLTGGEYTKANLHAIQELVDNSVRNQAEAKGVHVGKDYASGQRHTPKVQSASQGRPGSGSGPGEATVDMIGPDGKRYKVRADKAAAAQKKGWKPADG